MSEYGITEVLDDETLNLYIKKVVNYVLLGNCARSFFEYLYPSNGQYSSYSSNPADYCTEWSGEYGSECLTWNFCTFDEQINGYYCNNLEDYCNEYDVDGLTCIDFTDPGHNHECLEYEPDGGWCKQYSYDCYIYAEGGTTCLTEVDTWQYCTDQSVVDGVDVCAGWQFCTYDSDTNTDVCSEFDNYCNEYATDGVTCIDFTWPPIGYIDDGCHIINDGGWQCL